MDKKKNIAIVYGGDSSEHGVSLRSAQGLYSFFDKDKYNIYMVDLRGTDWKVELSDGITAQIDKNDFSFDTDKGRVQINYAYITIHGTPGENGLLQGYFDLIRLPYSTGGVLTEALTFDKYVLNNYLKNFDINVAKSVIVKRGEDNTIDEEKIERELGLPLFVKPSAGGSSFGVSKVKAVDQLSPALRKALMESEEAVVESYLDGMEISIGCYKTKEKSVVLPATEVVTSNEFFDYDAKYNGQVEEITPARISDDTYAKVATLTSRIYDLLHCSGIIRIDYIISKDNEERDKINLIEVNTTPGMTATSFIPQQVRAAGLDITKVLTEIVEDKI